MRKDRLTDKTCTRCIAFWRTNTALYRAEIFHIGKVLTLTHGLFFATPQAFNDPNSKRTFYSNTAEGTTQWDHPRLDFYKGAVYMARGGKVQLEAAAKKQPPNNEEVKEMAEYMGFEDSDNTLVRKIATLAVSAPLPPGWTEFTDAEGEAAFRDEITGAVKEEHPLDGYFAELARRYREKKKGALEPRGWPGTLDDTDASVDKPTPPAASPTAPAAPRPPPHVQIR